MTRKLLIILAVVVAMVSVSVTPAGARGRSNVVKGHQDLEFNLGLITEEGDFPFVSWIGEVELGGDAYFIVYYPTAEPKPIGSSTLFVENVEVYDTLDYGFTSLPAVIDEDSGEVLLPPRNVLTTFAPTEDALIYRGNDKAIGTASGHFLAGGTITFANPTADSKGALSDIKIGDRIFWRGFMADPNQTTFEGPYAIYSTWWRF